MSTKSIPARVILVAGLVILLIGGGTCYLLQRNPADPPEQPKGNNSRASQQRLTNFRDCAEKAGITFRMRFLPSEQGAKFKTNLYDHGCGVAIGDFDGDGLDDVYFLNQAGPNALFRNKGDGTFEDVTEKAGVALGDRVCVGATWADYDNDGHQDLYVTSTRGGNVLFHNNGDGTFTDVTKIAGLNHVGHSQTAVFFDYDNDGLLDLFLTNSAKWTLNTYDRTSHYYPGMADFAQMAQSRPETNVLYHNNGDGSFTDVTAKAGLAGKGWGGDVAVFDFNDDGYLDLVVTNMFGATQLYKNNGNSTFTDVTKETLGRTSFGAIGSKVFDFNNDSKLDILLVDMHSDMWLSSYIDPRLEPRDKMIKKYPRFFGPTYERLRGLEEFFLGALKIRYEDVIFGNTLFKKLPSGKFEEVSDKANMETFWPWGIATGDFDNDGFEDVFIPSGMGYPYGYWPNALMMNQGDGTFTDRAEATGIEPPLDGITLPERIGGENASRSSRCAAVADFEGKGRLSIMVNNFNDRPYYFRNHFPQKNYVAFRLQGTKSNRDAIGALVTIHVGKEVMVRQVHGAGGYLSQSSKTVHFGLGERTKVDRVKIVWPRGQTQIIENPEINALHHITEPREIKPAKR